MTLALTLLVQGLLAGGVALAAERFYRGRSPNVRLMILLLGIGSFLVPLPWKHFGVGTVMSVPARPVLPLVLLAGIALALVRLAMESWSLRLIIARTRAGPAALDAFVAELSERTEVETPRVLLSSEVNVPFAAQVHGGVIVLPAALGGAQRKRLEAVFLHELGHLRYGDLRICRALALFKALLWFHPVAHAIVRAARAAIEERSDDFAVRHSGGEAFTYAETLVELAAGLHDRRPLPALAMASAETGALAARLRRLAGSGPRRGWLLPLLIASSLIAAASFAAPRIVSIQPAFTHAHHHSH